MDRRHPSDRNAATVGRHAAVRLQEVPSVLDKRHQQAVMIAIFRWPTLCCVLTSCLLSGCSDLNCDKGFDYSLARDAKGSTTPRAALADWLVGDHEGAPDDGWHRDRTASPASGIVYSKDHWEVEVVEAPDGGYLVGWGIVLHHAVALRRTRSAARAVLTDVGVDRRTVMGGG